VAAPGQVATEDYVAPPDFPFPRVSEQTALSLKGVSASVMRLPQVHDTIKQGLVTYLIAVAREKSVSAYVGEGRNSWAAAHVSDVAHLYRLALEEHEACAKYHAVAEEGVPMREIAETNLPKRHARDPAIELFLQRVVSPIPVNPQFPNQARALPQVICGQMIAAYQIQHSQWLGHLVHI
jgi:nucleoside-diphosphate-sugar epimerase